MRLKDEKIIKIFALKYIMTARW